MSQKQFAKYAEDISDTISSQLLPLRECFKNNLSIINSPMKLTGFVLIKKFLGAVFIRKTFLHDY
jgi:hypothetical protein